MEGIIATCKSSSFLGIISLGFKPAHLTYIKQALIIALVGVAIPVIYLMSSRNTRARAQPSQHSVAATPPRSDPAERARAAKQQAEERDGKVKYEHPEDREPERFKPPFGQVHERKRVDGPPDGRNHQELNEKQRHI